MPKSLVIKEVSSLSSSQSRDAAVCSRQPAVDISISVVKEARLDEERSSHNIRYVLRGQDGLCHVSMSPAFHCTGGAPHQGEPNGAHDSIHQYRILAQR